MHAVYDYQRHKTEQEQPDSHMQREQHLGEPNGEFRICQAMALAPRSKFKKAAVAPGEAALTQGLSNQAARKILWW